MKQTQLGQKPRYYWLDVARVIAIVSITLNHAVNRAYDNYGNQMAEFLSISSASTLVKTVVTVFSRMGVPLFLMISGVLLLGKTMETGRDVRKFYRHNLLGLLITSEIWYFLMYWFLVLLKPGNTMLSELGVGGAIWGSVKNAFFFDQVTLGSMWYIPMILCLYVMIPFMAAALQKIPRKYLLLPMGLVFIGGMVVPNVNAWISLSGSGEKISFALNMSNLFSVYMLCVLAGDLIGHRAMARIPGIWILLGLVVTFAGSCAFQWYAYSRPANYIVSYNYEFAGLFLCCCFLFEGIRRKAHWFRRLQGAVTYLSQISFGIYFVHIMIMECLNWYLDLSMLRRPEKLFFLELVSVGGSILVIVLLSRVKVLKKYLFMMKR